MSEENENLLDVRHLCTYFPNKNGIVKSVEDVSFSVRKGEIFGLVGESGCGKSTTCRSLIRLVQEPGRIVAGSIFYKGQDLVKMNKRELSKIRGREIGMIFQEPMTTLNPVTSIGSQLMESIKDAGMTRQQKQERAVELLRMCGISSPELRLKAYPHQFSGGMRQRAMIAIALASKPNLLLADEPTTALDVTIQDQIMRLLFDLRNRLQMGMIIVTHDLGVASQMCDRVAVMYAGRIMEIAEDAALFRSPRHPYTYGLMNSLPLNGEKSQRLTPIPGSPPDLSVPMPGCPFEPRCGMKCERCAKELPELREVEPGHFSRCHCVEKMEQVEMKLEAASKGGDSHAGNAD